MRCLLMVAMLLVASVASADTLVDKLQDVSVTIKSGYGQGSGVMFNREVDGETVTYIWTAGHVVDNLRVTRDIIVGGNKKTVVEFKDAEIVQEFRQDGRRIGEMKMDARVVRFSDAEQGEDLALLEVRKRNFVPADQTIVFYDGGVPDLGTELYHVGSLLGQFGANSLTTGVVSQVGRVITFGANPVVFDQTTVTAFPGSSGGGVFLKDDGRYIGMLVRGAGEQFNLIVPARRLRSWAKQANIEWAVDASVPMPTKAELDKLPIEDSAAPGSILPTAPSPSELEFPYLLKVIDPYPA